jgi:hypothetical protein
LTKPSSVVLEATSDRRACSSLSPSRHALMAARFIQETSNSA